MLSYSRTYFLNNVTKMVRYWCKTNGQQLGRIDTPEMHLPLMYGGVMKSKYWYNSEEKGWCFQQTDAWSY